jgi:hypothetical protein
MRQRPHRAIRTSPVNGEQIHERRLHDDSAFLAKKLITATAS